MLHRHQDRMGRFISQHSFSLIVIMINSTMCRIYDNMNSQAVILRATLCLALIGTPLKIFPQRWMENLDRGVVALRLGDDSVYVGWRMLGTDPADIGFNVYRLSSSSKAVKLNRQLVVESTNFIDTPTGAGESLAYFVRPVIKKKLLGPSDTARVWQNNYLSIPVRTPEGYSPNDVSAGDLDGDGQYDFVVHMTGRGSDNARAGFTSEPILDAYKLDGTFLWRINLGRNIREGAHYTQFMVYDLDGDGRAEVACKTADGTIDGQGNIIGNPDADYRTQGEPWEREAMRAEPERGREPGRFGRTFRRPTGGLILSGPEYLTVFNGKTGAALVTVPYIPPRHPETNNPTVDQMREVWGDASGNRMDRYLACIAYLDGERPSLVMCRGYYTRAVLAAWNYRDGKLNNIWVFDSDDGTPGNETYRGQGNHNLSVGDVDGDGRDEIIYGACVIDDNGKGLYSTGLGHGDAIHFSDLDPENPGLEVFNIQERFDDAGANFREAGTGKVLWKKPSLLKETFGGDRGEGPGRGCAINIDPRYPGSECWVKGAGITDLFSAKGEVISGKTPQACNFAIWWDNDLLRELLDGNTIFKWNWEESRQDILFRDDNCRAVNGSKSTPCLSADILGDWREEVIWRTADNRELRIYTTTIPSTNRFYTFMHDPVYRLGVAWQNVAYNQPPHTGFYIGDDMKPQLRCNIRIAK